MSPNRPGTTNDENFAIDKAMSEAPGTKRVYSSPTLIHYGSVAKLTKSGSGGIGEGLLMLMVPCL